MAADPSNSDWVTIAVLVVIAVAAVVNCFTFILVCTILVKPWWRLFRLGGVATLRRSLGYPCTICRDSMDAGEEVRTLSCGHVFHRGGSDKCELGIDQWLLAGNSMSLQSCPICRQVPHPVLPWKQPPPSSPPPSSSQTSDSDSDSDSEGEDSEDNDEELLLPAHWFDETLPE